MPREGTGSTDLKAVGDVGAAGSGRQHRLDSGRPTPLALGGDLHQGDFFRVGRAKDFDVGDVASGAEHGKSVVQKVFWAVLDDLYSKAGLALLVSPVPSLFTS